MHSDFWPFYSRLLVAAYHFSLSDFSGCRIQALELVRKRGIEGVFHVQTNQGDETKRSRDNR
jgi:hypothetical protein